MASKSEVWTQVIPGLLQTGDYARALIERSRQWQHGRQIQNFVDLRIARQASLRRDSPMQLWCVLDEAALQRRVGGGQVMKDQLTHLLEVTEDLTHVAVQILTFEQGAHAGVDGPFSLLHFPAGPPVAVVEPMTTSLYLEEDSDIGRYETAFNHIRSEALDVAASRKYIRKLIKDCYP